MPIKVVCACGAAFAAKDELAGRTVACPKCKQPLTIGAPQAASVPQAAHANAGLFDDLGLKARDTSGNRCPGCAADLPPNAVLCVKCGYNLKLGKKMQTMNMAADPLAGGGGHVDATAMIMARAAMNAEDDVVQEKLKTNEGMPLWILATAAFCCVLFGIVMSLIPQSTALIGTASILLVCSFLLVVFSVVSIAIRAFIKNPLFGVIVIVGDVAIIVVAVCLILFISEETMPPGATRFVLMLVGACSTGYAYSDESCSKFMFYLQVAYVLRLIGLVLLVLGVIIGAFTKEETTQLPPHRMPAATAIVRASDMTEALAILEKPLRSACC